MLSGKEASSLLKRVNFPGEDLSLLNDSSERKKIIREQRQPQCHEAAAIEIQRIWRGHRTRRLFKEILGPLLTDVCGEEVQIPLPPVIEDAELSPQKAAEIIQRSWRRYKFAKVYRFYRDLINFSGRGEPSRMLRCINPKEAALLDRAAGIRIRFRLGGETFPPNVYYKIYTYRNIVDVCAYSPRDYTAMHLRKPLPRNTHNKVDVNKEQKMEEDKTNWYQRWENNGWRLVPTRLFTRIDQDPIQNDTAKQTRDFPHSKLKRKEDVEKRKKEKKIQWLKKLYKQGMMDGCGLKGPEQTEIRTTAEQMVDMVEKCGMDVVEEEDVDELLSWTNGLSFDDYSVNWQVLGTSTTSEDTDIQGRFFSGDLYKSLQSGIKQSSCRTAKAAAVIPNPSSPPPET